MKIPGTIQKLLKKINGPNKKTIKRKFFRLLSLKMGIVAGGFILFLSVILVFVLSKSTSEVKAETGDPGKLKQADSLNLEQSLQLLNSLTSIDLKYHRDVQYYVNLYLNDRRPALERIQARSELYFPIIEEMLDKHSLPLELKYLAVVESGLNPLAKSKSGAVGLWQFLYNTCYLLDLKVNTYVDERRDVYKSTDAACRYLSYLYSTYNDWNLALAAYNGGPGEVRKAIERSGGITDYWELRPYLSKQAADYVPAFIAFNYLLTCNKATDLKPEKVVFRYYETDTLHLSSPASIFVIARELDMDPGELTYLNPVYTKDYIPAGNSSSTLVLPKKKVDDFFKKESLIYSKVPTKKNYRQLVAEAGLTDGRTCMLYIVKSGDFVHKLALEHNCTVENIRAWNNLDNNNLYPGQELKIWVKD